MYIKWTLVYTLLFTLGCNKPDFAKSALDQGAQTSLTGSDDADHATSQPFVTPTTRNSAPTVRPSDEPSSLAHQPPEKQIDGFQFRWIYLLKSGIKLQQGSCKLSSARIAADIDGSSSNIYAYTKHHENGTLDIIFIKYHFDPHNSTNNKAASIVSLPGCTSQNSTMKIQLKEFNKAFVKLAQSKRLQQMKTKKKLDSPRFTLNEGSPNDHQEKPIPSPTSSSPDNTPPTSTNESQPSSDTPSTTDSQPILADDQLTPEEDAFPTSENERENSSDPESNKKEENLPEDQPLPDEDESEAREGDNTLPDSAGSDLPPPRGAAGPDASTNTVITVPDSSTPATENDFYKNEPNINKGNPHFTMGVNVSAISTDPTVFTPYMTANIFKFAPNFRETMLMAQKSEKKGYKEINPAIGSLSETGNQAPCLNPGKEVRTHLYQSAQQINIINNGKGDNIYTLAYKGPKNLDVDVNRKTGFAASEQVTCPKDLKLNSIKGYQFKCFKIDKNKVKAYQDHLKNRVKSLSKAALQKHNESTPLNGVQFIIKNKGAQKSCLNDIRVYLPGGICKGNFFKRVALKDKASCKNSSFEPFMIADLNNKGRTLFNPDYLSYYKPFKVLRTMNITLSSPKAPERCNDILKSLPKPSNYYTALDDKVARCFLENFSWRSEKTNTARNELKRAKKDDITYRYTYLSPRDMWKGVPFELIIELSNILNAHPWINIPVNLDRESNKVIAKNFATHLKSHLIPRIEYSNETWNYSFWGNVYLKHKGRFNFEDRQVISKKNKEFKSGEIPVLQEQYVKHSTEYISSWKTAFAGRQVLGVLGTWQTNSHYTRDMLSKIPNNDLTHIDALATATYYWSHFKLDPRNPKIISDNLFKTILKSQSPLEKLFSIIGDQNSSNPRSLHDVINSQIHLQRAQADSKGLKLFSYEGGPHLTINDVNLHNYLAHKTNSNQNSLYLPGEWNGAQPEQSFYEQYNKLRSLFAQANKHQKMKELNRKLFEGWQKVAGNGDFIIFTGPQNYTHWSNLGISESLHPHKEKAPKYDGILEFASKK